MKQKLFFILFLFSKLIFSQSGFNVLPEVDGGVNNQAVTYSLHADSFGITLVGAQPYYKMNDSSRYYTRPIIMRFNYKGELVKKKELKHANSGDIYPFLYPFVKRNDSIIYYYTFSGLFDSAGYGLSCIFEINARTLEFIRYNNFRIVLSPQHSLLPNYSTLTSQDHFLMSNFYKVNDKNYSLLGIAELDSNLNIIRSDTFPNDTYMLAPNYISQNSIKDVEVVGTAFDKKFQLPIIPFYIRIDSNHQVKKLVLRKDLPNVGMPLADDYGALQESNGDWIMAMDSFAHNQNRSTIYQIPKIYRFSRELDSIIWVRDFYMGQRQRSDTHYMTSSIVKCIDNSGYIAVGDKFSYNADEADEGIAYKASPSGDSLWFRKYIPVGFDSTDMTWEKFYPIVATPYNTYVVSAYYYNLKRQGVYPWLIHMDTDGCIVPGCNKSVNVQDIINKKEKAFEIFPNPVTNHRLSFYSKINLKDTNLELISITGQKLYSKKITFEIGAQYFLDIPKEVSKGEYLIRISNDGFAEDNLIFIL